MIISKFVRPSLAPLQLTAQWQRTLVFCGEHSKTAPHRATMTSFALRTMAVARTAALRSSPGGYARALSTASRGGANIDPGTVMDPTKSKYVVTKQEAPYTKGKHRSNALELIEKQDIIYVEGNVAVCDGGGGVLGHPLEYIKVGNRGGEPVSCVYCGLKYAQKPGGH